jgi:hypothetical protein
MRTSTALVVAAVTMALAACDRPHDNQAPSVAPEAIKGASNTTPPPPLPLNTDVNAATAETASKSMPNDVPPQPDKGGANEALSVAAQDAAAKASDTASGDEAKKGVVASGKSDQVAGKGGSGGNKAPGDELTKSEESSAMPKPGQANDHSTLAPAK